MPENPISDVIEFLTDPSWPTPVFWLLVIASVGIAILIWHRRPDQQDFSYLAQWSFRFVMGDFWWQQSLWKLPSLYTNHPKAPLTTGLTYWMHQMVQYAAIPLQSDLVNNVVLPHFYVFAPIVYAAEGLTDVSLMLGMFTRVFVVIGALQLHNITIYGLAFIPRRTSGRGLTSSCSCCN